LAGLEAVRQLAHRLGDVHALGIHPLHVPEAVKKTWICSTTP